MDIANTFTTSQKNKLLRIYKKLFSLFFKNFYYNEEDVLNTIIKLLSKITPSKIILLGLVNKSQTIMRCYKWIDDQKNQIELDSILNPFDFNINSLITTFSINKEPHYENNCNTVFEYQFENRNIKLNINNYLTVSVFEEDSLKGLILVANNNKYFNEYDIYIIKTIFNKIWRFIKINRKIHKLKINKKYDEIIGTSSVAIAITDLEGKFVTANKQAFNLIGIKKLNELRPEFHSIFDLVVEKDRPKIINNIQILANRGFLKDVEYDLYKNDKSIVPVEISSSIIVDENKKTFNLMSIVRDITEKRRMEFLLKENYEKYYKVFNNSIVGIIYLKEFHFVFDANEAAIKILGYSEKKEFIGLHADKITYNIEERYKALQIGLRLGYLPPFEVQLMKKNGEPIDTIVSAIAEIRNNDLYEIYLFIIDNTEKKTEKKELERLNLETVKRYNQLHVIYSISEILECANKSIAEKLQEIVEVISSNHLNGNIIYPKIVIDNKEFKSNNFQYLKNSYKLVISIKGHNRGFLEVFYLSENEELNSISNSPDEKKFLKIITEQIERVIEKTEMNDVLLMLAKSPGEYYGKSLFKEITIYLSLKLSMDFVCICRIDASSFSGKTEVVYNNHNFEENFTYSFHNSPCVRVIEDDVYYLLSDALQKYPNSMMIQKLKAESFYGITLKNYSQKAIGMIILIGKKPLKDLALIESYLKIISIRIAAELEIKISSEELNISERKYQKIFNTSAVGIICINTNKIITAVNNSALKLLEYEKYSDLIGQPSEHLSAIQEERIKAWEVGLQIGYLPPQEVHLKKKDGSVIDCIVSASIELKDNQLVELVMFIIDNSEKKEMEKALFDYQKNLEKMIEEKTKELYLSDAIMKSIFSNTNRGVMYIDNKFNIVFTDNNYIGKSNKFPSDKIKGKNFFELFPSKENEEIFNQVMLSQKSHKVTNKPYISSRAPREELTYWDWTLDPVLNNNGEVQGLILIVENVTERVKTEQIILQNSKMLIIGEMSARIVHELNQPLTSAKLCLELIKDEVLLPNPNHDELSENISDLEILINKISKITNEFRYFSKPSNRERNYVNINQLIEKTLLMFKEQYLSDRITLNISLDKNLSKVYIDENQLEQVFVNLLKNAMEALEEQKDKIITIVTLNINNYIKIQICDNGKGLTEWEKGNIFIPYFSTKERSKGTGLGLAISQKIISDHGGSISVNSTTGNGAIFEILLPISDI